MQDYLIVIISILSGVVVLSVLFLLCFYYIKRSKANARRKPARAASRIHPKIPEPIYTISTNSVEKETSATDTMTTRKLSMMFESKKRLHSAFSQRSPYFDFENSPQPRHKEYLDFNDIENIIPRKSQSISYSPRHANFNYSENPVFSEMNQCKKSVSCYPAEKSRSVEKLGGKIGVLEERPFSSTFEPVREVLVENQVSFRRDRPDD